MAAGVEHVDASVVGSGFGASVSAYRSMSSSLIRDPSQPLQCGFVDLVRIEPAQILGQASTAMLAQANQSQQGVMKLLG